MKNYFLAQLCIFTLLLFTKSTIAEPVSVQVVDPKVSQQTESLLLIGTVEAPQSSALASLQAGLIASLLVEKGQAVEKGQTLMTLDSQLIELGVQQAQAEVEAAMAAQQESKRLYQESLKLSQQQLAAETLIAELKANVTIANAEVRKANTQLQLQQSMLSRHTLKAPFAGLIAERYVNIGEWVTQQTPIFQLVSQDNLRLAVSIPQEYYRALSSSKDIMVTVTPDFIDATSISAKLNVLVNSAANISRTLVGLIELPNDAGLLVGMSAQAEINLPSSERAIAWVPKSAIKQHPDGGNSVFTVIKNQVKQVSISIVEYNGELVGVTGITEQLPVVISGVAVLKNDALVAVNSEVSL
ncbi:efflux RND transporter periplasmic adaptor subunit [uncultured Paraglaciecola sp.]|uniref:efflux RND transporter periplasmic adaptor subunit n=1 Tax=uncultured Paraglaciecola sp. TaxID=1765024 RepID=UPI00259985ED|nr:efflux RND transporter periplasmic adaptor subunit [uncultured Paraglaciecola sp.]